MNLRNVWISFWECYKLEWRKIFFLELELTIDEFKQRMNFQRKGLRNYQVKKFNILKANKKQKKKRRKKKQTNKNIKFCQFWYEYILMLLSSETSLKTAVALTLMSVTSSCRTLEMWSEPVRALWDSDRVGSHKVQFLLLIPSFLIILSKSVIK